MTEELANFVTFMIALILISGISYGLGFIHGSSWMRDKIKKDE